jgi:hypothetical protein
MHPPLRCAWLGRDTSLRQSPPSRRRLSHPGGGLRSGPAPPLRPLDTLIDAGFHSGASVPLAPAREPCRGFAQHLAPGGPRPIAAAVVGCNGREGPRPSLRFKSAKRAAVRRREAERASDGGARQTPTGWMRTRREVFRPSAPRHPRRMDDASYAGCANGSRESRTSRPRRSSALTELAGRAMPPPLSRASLSRRDAWRRTRPRTQSFDCGAGRGLSQAHFGTAGEVAAASPAY